MARPEDKDQLYLDNTIARMLSIVEECELNIINQSDDPLAVKAAIRIVAIARKTQRCYRAYRPRLLAMREENKELWGMVNGN